MKYLLLKRLYRKDTYTIGKLYINNEFFCDTCEDKCRDLYDYMPLKEIKAKKVYGETAIPYGHYKVEITYSSKFKKKLPLVENVKGFDGIRIHSGNTAQDSLGCILVGENKAKGKVLNSRATMAKLMEILTELPNEEIVLEISK